MNKTMLLLYIIFAISGVIASLFLLPDTFSLTRKIGAGLFSGIGCILILTAARLYKPQQNDQSE
jgi:hypothetical protein